MIGGIPAASGPTNSIGSSLAVRQPRNAQLLPPPTLDVGGLNSVEDALGVLYADRVKQGEQDTRSVNTEAKQHQQASEAQHKKLMDALADQRAAERASKGFWADLKKVASTVAKIATVVASAAAIVMTGGTTAPAVLGVAGLVLSSGGMAVRELKLAGKDSDKVAMGMEIGGAALSMAGLVGGALQAEKMGAAAAEASSVSSTAGTVKVAAQVTGATATAASGLATVEIAGYTRDSELAAADAEQARGLMQQHQRDTKMLIDTLTAAQEAQRDALSGTMGAIEACNNATAVAIAGVRG